LQKQTLIGLSQIDGKKVSVSLPWSLKKRPDHQQRPAEENKWEKGVISHVPLDLTVDDIKEETGSIWAHRITRKNNSGDGYVPTMAVIIAYEDDDLPKYVNIGFTRHKVSVYIPTPLQCAKCQRYGHKAGRCHSDKPRCPRCARRTNMVPVVQHQSR